MAEDSILHNVEVNFKGHRFDAITHDVTNGGWNQNPNME